MQPRMASVAVSVAGQFCFDLDVGRGDVEELDMDMGGGGEKDETVAAVRPAERGAGEAGASSVAARDGKRGLQGSDILSRRCGRQPRGRTAAS